MRHMIKTQKGRAFDCDGVLEHMERGFRRSVSEQKVIVMIIIIVMECIVGL